MSGTLRTIGRNKSPTKCAKLNQDVQYLRWFVIKVIIDWYVYTYYRVVTIATHRVMRRPRPECYYVIVDPADDRLYTLESPWTQV